jgi:TPR repeat protein
MDKQMESLYLKKACIIFSSFILFFSQVCFCMEKLSEDAQLVERTIDNILKSDADAGGKFNKLSAEELVDLGRSASKAHDYSSAFTYLSIASRKNSAEACYMIGVMIDKGWWKLKSTPEAFRWFFKAFDLGHSDAANNIGNMFEEGRLGSPDYERAIQWYTIAAKKGNAMAHYNLGILYTDGRGVPKNTDLALEHFRTADSLGGIPEARRMISFIMRRRNR